MGDAEIPYSFFSNKAVSTEPEMVFPLTMSKGKAGGLR